MLMHDRIASNCCQNSLLQKTDGFDAFHKVSHGFLFFLVSFPHFLSLTLGTGAEKDARSTFGACSSEGASVLLVWVSSHQSI